MRIPSRISVAVFLVVGTARAFVPSITTRTSVLSSPATRATNIQRYYVSTTSEPELSRTASLPPLVDGIYELTTPDDHKALIEAFPDRLIVLKVFAPWCRACLAMDSKFKKISTEPEYANLPIVWANLSIQHNKKFVQSLGVLALPTIQFYVNGRIYDTFACGPSKLPILKRKLTSLIDNHVDKATKEIISTSVVMEPETEENAPTISKEQQQALVAKIPYFQSLNLADLDRVLDHAVVRSYPARSVLVREGEKPNKFFVIAEGEVEICQKTVSDPFQNEQYLGTVINILDAYDFFGERSLITGEPCAASLRAATDVKLWEFDQRLFPGSNALSGSYKMHDLEVVNDKYGVDMMDLRFGKQLKDTKLSSQTRGSVNRPESIPEIYDGVEVNDDDIFQLLKKFQNIRTVSSCFQYIQQHNVAWGEPGVTKRRNMLVNRLDPTQRTEYAEIFNLIDGNGDGCVQVDEMKRLYHSIGEQETELFQQDSACVLMSQEDFMGLMAESYFYNLFRDIFSSLDKNQSGFVKAKDLDQILNGIRDLISDDRKSVIDVDDQDMLIDYEQFSRMLLGTTLI